MKKNSEIFLQRIDFGDEKQVLDMIASDEELKNTFSGGKNTISRLINSIYTALIKKEEESIGFVMLVNNPKTDVNEIDMGILEKYRSKGYGTIALKLLKEIIIQNELQVEVQIKKVNIGAIKSTLNNGFVLAKEDKDHNYYVIGETKKR